MKTTPSLSEQLPEIRKYVVEILDRNADRSIYTTIGRLYRMEKNMRTIIAEEKLSEEDGELLQLMLYIQMIEMSETKGKSIDFERIEKELVQLTKKLCKKFEIEDTVRKKTIRALQESIPIHPPTTGLSEAFRDMTLMEFAGDNGRDHLKQRYEEMVLRDFDLSQSNWYDTLIGLTSNVETHTQYGRTQLQPRLEKLNKGLRKEKKEIENRKSLMLKKELNISEQEIKKLRKDIDKAKGRDERGIQTLFRTTIKNHYTLNEMIDRKASIMITVNSIILSLVMGGLIGENEGVSLELIPVFLLSITSICSIIFAVIAIRPLLTQGDFTEEEIRNKEGNLLYFGNFHNMHFRDFEWGFLQMLNDKNYLYGSMIRDYYYQGMGLHRKYKFIRMSLTIFLFGFGASFLSFLVFRVLG